MAQIQPFKGYRFNPPKAGEIASLISQPYDTITPEMQEAYYKKSDYNIVRIIKGKEYDDDSTENNQYTRARDFFQDWVEKGIIVQDDKPSIYVYDQIYQLPNGETKSRLGFIALGKLESLDSGIVFPHEFTHSKAKVDRRNLLITTQVHWGQIFMLYSDPENAINTILRKQQELSEPLFTLTAEDNVGNKIWRVTDPAVIEQVQKLMADKSILIADGHHRYETAYGYMQEHPEQPSAQYVMMTLVNMDDPGLSVLPTHRLLKPLPADNPDAFWEKAKEIFDIKEFKISEKKQFLTSLIKQGQQTNTFGFYHGDNVFYTLAVKNAGIKDKFYPDASRQYLKDLDVSIFDELVINYALGLKEEKEKYIAYSKDADETIQLVDSGEFKYAFFLNATKVSQVRSITSTGQRMPQKSTYFYPKLITGLIFYKL